MRLVFLWMAAVFLSVFIFNYLEAGIKIGSTEPPRFEVGDKWIFIDRRDTSEISLKMIKEQGDIYVFEETTKIGSGQINYDSQLNRIGGDKKLDFPLYPGKKWSWRKWSRAALVKGDFEVLAEETHRVPAGVFKALKIRAVIDAYFLGLKHSWRGTILYWYARCARNIIDVAPDFKSSEIIPMSLKSYKFQNAPNECG